MKGKGKQFVAPGRSVLMAFPGGAGYGEVAQRSSAQLHHDVAMGYITPDAALADYAMTATEIADVLARARLGEVF
jgi:N-methylhydantoinase B